MFNEFQNAGHDGEIKFFGRLQCFNLRMNGVDFVTCEILEHRRRGIDGDDFQLKVFFESKGIKAGAAPEIDQALMRLGRKRFRHRFVFACSKSTPYTRFAALLIGRCSRFKVRIHFDPHANTPGFRQFDGDKISRR